jgi:hypothetical protein
MSLVGYGKESETWSKFKRSEYVLEDVVCGRNTLESKKVDVCIAK